MAYRPKRCGRWASSDPSQAPARERFQSLAERRVTVGLLIQEVLQQHNIKLDHARVEQRREGARGALRETRGGRAVLPQQPWHDGSGRGRRSSRIRWSSSCWSGRRPETRC